MILANHGIISSSGALSFDADALAFITAASITNNTQKTAINTLVTDLKTYNIWTKMKALYPFVGGTASSHKWNLKDPRDLDAAYRLVFNGGWTHSSTGALPNGTTAFADTKLAPSAMGQNSIHASFYSRTNTTGQIWDLGSYDANGGVIIGVNYINNNESVVYVNVKSGDNSLAIANPSTGLYMANRISSTTNLLYRNSTLIINGTNTSFPPNNLNIYLAAYNGGTPQGYSTREQAFASIGDGLTNAEATNFYTAVQNFNTTLSRQV